MRRGLRAPCGELAVPLVDFQFDAAGSFDAAREDANGAGVIAPVPKFGVNVIAEWFHIDNPLLNAAGPRV
jgi:hypothetical protein